MLCLFRISQDSWKASPEKILHNTRGVGGPTPARHPALKNLKFSYNLGQYNRDEHLHFF
jgi:hypothetical protein